MTPDAGGAHPGAHVHSGTVSGHAPADSIIISDAHLLFTGDFKRAGLDLVVSGDGHEVVLHDYFKGEKRAALASPDGAHLTGDIITALTGHTQFAQADGSPSVAQVIGHVTKLTGTATAIRNGVSIILNQGDNVNKGDVVASGSDSTLGITFIDGTVFGLASNAKMVLNEMIYDPNGSDNKSLISLVQGTISFVAGATAKHGDMKVDTPVATMGIRGTAVLVEIDFTVPATGGAPPAKFQVLVEPDGTTGSYILFDKTTLTPIATVNQAGTQTIVNGQGGVNFLSSAQLSADAQKIITDVFALKFSDLNNPNTKLAFNQTDSIVPFNTFIKTAGGDNVLVTLQTVNVADKPADPNKSASPGAREHIPIRPDVVTQGGATAELALTTGSAAIDSATGTVRYADINPGDVPTVSTSFTSFVYQNAALADVTATLTAAQMAAIKAVEAPLTVVQDPANINLGTANWTYNVADGAFDFLAVGEVLTLTYTARVDNNYTPNDQFTEVTFTITITGTNDTPVITSSTQAAAITELLATHDSTAPDTATGTIKFVDADLTDTHAVTITGVAISGVTTGLASPSTVLGWLALSAPVDSTDGVTGSRTWTFTAQDKSFDYLAVGETVTFTYTVQVDDHHGGVVTQPVTITITGTNDTPVITSGTQAATLQEIIDAHGSDTPETATGTVTFTDLDLSDTHAVTITGVVASDTTTGLAPNATVLSWLSLGALTDATGGVTGSKGWTFTAPDHYFDYLALGEQVTLTYTVQVDDHHGGVVTQPVTITVTGTNDTPVITSGTQSSTQPELTATHDSDTPDTATGTITFTDLDLSDTHTVTITGVVASDITTGLASNPTVLNWLSFGTLHDSTSTGGAQVTGSDTWTFSAPDHYFDYLAKGEQVTLTYTVQIDDHKGGVVTQPVTITITGTNDTPVITSGTQAATLQEIIGAHGSDTPETATGTVTFTDLDLSDTHAVTITGVVASDTTTGLASNATVLSWLSLGALTDATGGHTGSKGWTFTAPDHYFDYLALGEQVTLTYTVQVDDHQGGVVTQPVTITVTGTNDTPVITSGTQSSTQPELTATHDSDTPDTATGTITFTDLDLSDTHTVTITSVVASDTTTGLASNPTVLNWLSFGTLHDSTSTGGAQVTGSDTWTFSAPDHYFDYLADGEQVTLTYTVQVDDHKGGVVTQPVTITVTGTNDTPVITSGTQSAIVKEAADTHDSDTPDTATGTVTFTDLDLSDTHAMTITGVAASDTTTGLDTNAMLGWLSLGALTDSTGGHTGSKSWTFSAPDHYFDYLADGEHLTLTYTVEVDDHKGGVVDQTVTITVDGRNDAPVAHADSDLGTIIEAGNNADDTVYAGVSTTSGNVLTNDTDLDLSDTHHVVGVVKGTASGVLSGGVGNSVTGFYGSLLLNEDGTWTYTLDNHNSATDALAQGAIAYDTFSYTEDDHHGGTSTTTLTIQIRGTNDAPVTNNAPVAATDLNSGAAIAEKGVAPGNTPFAGNDTAQGNVLANDGDVDTGDSKTVQGVAKGTPPGLQTDHVGSAVAGTFGSVTIGSDGKWTYTLDNDNAATQALKQDQHVTDVFTYTMHDAAGATSSATLTIDVYGTNDAPVAVADTAAVTVTEAGVADGGNTAFLNTQTTSGNVLDNDTDVDNGHLLTVAAVTGGNVGSPVAGIYGSVTINPNGSYSYTLNDTTGSAADHLAQGAQVTDVFTYTTTDEHGATSTSTLTINITGTNDAPVAVADVVATMVTEAGVADGGNAAFVNTQTASGDVLANDTDVDNGHILKVAAVEGLAGKVGTSVAGTYGSVVIHDDGSYTYTLNDTTGSAADQLAQGDRVTDVFNYTTVDEHGARASSTLTINITGTNDAPTVTGALSNSASEGDATFTHNLLDGATDIDHGETATLSVTGLSYSVDGGTASATAPAGISFDGHTLTVDPSNPAFDYLAVGEQTVITVSYNVQDAHGATVAQTETITIHGTNDAPVVTAASTVASGSVTEATDGSADETNNATHQATGAIHFTDADVSDAHTVTPSFVSAILHDASGHDVQLGADLGALTIAAESGTTTTITFDNPVDHGLHATYSEGGYTISDLLNDNPTDGLRIYQPGDPYFAGSNAIRNETWQSTIYLQRDGHGAFDLNSLDVDSLAPGHTFVTFEGLKADGTVVSQSFTTDDVSGLEHVTFSSAFNDVTAVRWSQNSAGASVQVDNINVTSHQGPAHEAGWTYSVADNALDFLAQGESITVTYDAAIDDHHQGTAMQPIVVTLNGANDAPTLAAVSTAAIADTSANDNFSPITGTLTGNDVDEGETAGLQYAAIDSAGNVSNGAIGGTYGTLAVGLDGHYQYSPNAAAINALNVGNYTDTFIVQTKDAQGASGTASFIVHITGADDAPVANDFSIADGTEDTDITLTAAQLLAHATDVDSTLTVTGVSATTAHGGTVDFNSGVATYHPAANYNGPDSFTYTVSDGSLTSTGTVSFNVGAVNDAPTAFAPSIHYSATEQTPLVISGTGLQVDDVDGNGGIEVATLSVGEGVLSIIPGTNNLTVAGNGSSSVTLTGTVGYIEALLAGNNSGSISYTSTSDNPGPSTTLTLSIDDGGNSGAGSAHSASATSTIDITPVNDAPVAAAPTTHYSATAQSDLNLHSTGLSVSDVDGGSGIETATLSASQGIITIDAGDSGVTGITGNDSGSVSFTGTVAQINALLNSGTGTVVYNDNAGSSAATVALTLSIHDNGNTGGGDLSASASATIDVASSAPVVDLNGSATGVDNSASVAPDDQPHSVFSDLTITAASTTIAHATVTYSGIGDGFISFDGVSFDGNHFVTGLGHVVNTNITVTSVAQGENHDQFGLQLSGVDSIANYQAVLGALSIQSWNNLSGATFAVTVNDGNLDSAPATETVDLAVPSTWDVWPASVNDSWGNDTIWSLLHAPTASDFVLISANATVTDAMDAGADQAVAGLVLASAAELDISQGSSGVISTFGVSGGLNNAGLIDVKTATFSVSGDDVLDNGTIQADGVNGTVEFDHVFVELKGGSVLALNGGQVSFVEAEVLGSSGAHLDAAPGSSMSFQGGLLSNVALGYHDRPGFFGAAIFNVVADSSGPTQFLQIGTGDFSIGAATAVNVHSGATLALQGDIDNQGVINVGDSSGLATLKIENFVTLSGTVNVGAHGVITGASSGAFVDTLDIVNGSIGNGFPLGSSGLLGNGHLTIINEASSTISGNFTIDTGTGTFTNDGIVRSDSNIDIAGDVVNHGALQANGYMQIQGNVSGNGTATIAGTLEFHGASDAAVTMGSIAMDNLVLDDAAHFNGTVTGFGYGDKIDLVGITSDKIGFSNGSGVLNLDFLDGVGMSHSIALTGSGYAASNFVLIDDGHGGTNVMFDHAPEISTDLLSVGQDGNGHTTISGLFVMDDDVSTGPFTIAASTGGHDLGTSVTPATGSGTLSDINTTLASGITYDQGQNAPATDQVKITVSDSLGATDTVNLIFNVAQNPVAPVTLTSTTDKDVLFGTGYQDQFVFADHSNHDTILNFTHGQDKIDLSAIASTGVNDWFTNHVITTDTETVVTIDAADSILIRNATNLTVNDFILHPGGTT